MTWSETFLDVFKKNDVRFISYVPDNVLTPLIIDDKPGAAQTPRDPVLIGQRFMKGLGTGRGAELD